MQPFSIPHQSPFLPSAQREHIPVVYPVAKSSGSLITAGPLQTGSYIQHFQKGKRAISRPTSWACVKFAESCSMSPLKYTSERGFNINLYGMYLRALVDVSGRKAPTAGGGSGFRDLFVSLMVASFKAQKIHVRKKNLVSLECIS